MDISFFMIKPDGILHNKQILTDIESYFRIKDYKESRICDQSINILYSQIITDPSLPALKEYLSEGPCGMGIIYCSIDSLIKIAGTQSDPKLCEPYTIRFKYGSGWGYTRSGLSILRNAIHRPKTVEQNEAQLHHFYKI